MQTSTKEPVVEPGPRAIERDDLDLQDSMAVRCCVSIDNDLIVQVQRGSVVNEHLVGRIQFLHTIWTQILPVDTGEQRLTPQASFF